MSRLIVKGLPGHMKEERLRQIFSAYGHLTDCSLKYTKSGCFRKFAFIGYKLPKDAEAAEKHFNNTFIDTSKIKIEFAKDFGDSSKPRAWSKYSSESSSFKSVTPQADTAENKSKKLSKKEKKAKKKNEKMKEMLGDLKDDPEFSEFLVAHKAPSTKNVWSDDVLGVKQDETTKRDDLCFDADNSEASDETSDGAENEDTTEIKIEKNKMASKKQLSDLDYLKSKMTDNSLLSESSSDEDSNQKGSNKPKSLKTKGKTEAPHAEKSIQPNSKLVVKMRKLQGNYNEKVIREFFNPLCIRRINIPRNARKKPIGIAYVEFGSDKEMDEALRRNKSYLNNKKVFLKKAEVESTPEPQEKEIRPWEMKNKDDEFTESIAESGRLFLRNLPYCCTEDDLETLFKKYGLLTEVYLPVDFHTKKNKGFAFITYMIPEHAVKAFTELDGASFQGRMLHILPSKPPKEEDPLTTENSSFKKQKEAKQKSVAKSSHNWNTVFLGANAVAELMAEKYGISKDQLLDPESSQSLGVRLALGETQLVSETREFLTENGVCLDSFSQAGAERSKTTIIAKNLPSGAKSEDLHAVFSKHGTIARIVLPPSGITALIEFVEPTEARNAFTNLAYSKFQFIPLYLEWAPMKVFTGPPVKMEIDDSTREDIDSKNKTIDADDEDDSESEREVEPESIIFVKNLNFETTEEDLHQYFRKCGKIRSTSISRKKDMKNPGKFLSMGYGFVEFQKRKGAQKAIKELQNEELNGHQLELKISNRATLQPKIVKRKKQEKTKQKNSKILVKNIPFEAKQHEIEEMFKVFGELKSVRLPKKLQGTGSHRGFGFVDFMTNHDAKRAFNALCHSTHLYGRRLVLEWAATEENLDDLRKKTAEHFHDEVPSKRLKKANIMKELEGE